jgi:ADP-ribosyl-[dinitrogen reductase] hydrolase
VEFDRESWREEAVRYLSERENIRTADRETLARLFTTIVEAEKYTNGVLAEMIEKGVVVELLQRLGELHSRTEN